MIGASLGSYRITDIIGKGGTGVVYQAEHVLIGRRVAIKQLLPALVRDSELVDRFFNEARAAARVQHPGLVEIFDFGYHEDGSAYIVMELLEGESLGKRIARERPLAVATALQIAHQLALALHAVHEQGIVHRDLKPENLYLIEDRDTPGGVRPKVLDFGIAKLALSEDLRSVKTQTGVLIGTPCYMAPEQCRDAAMVDRRADIYSLGCILYEMLVGTMPFEYDNWAELVAAHISQPPPPLTQRDGRISFEIEATVLRALAKQPGERFPTMLEFANALEASWLTIASGGVPMPVTRPKGASVAAIPAAPRALAEAAKQVAPAGSIAEIAPRRHMGRIAIGAAIALGGAAGLYFAIGPRGEPPRVASERATPARAPVVTDGAAAAATAMPPSNAAVTGSDRRPDRLPDQVPDQVPDHQVPDQQAQVPASQVQLTVTSLPLGADVYRAGDSVRIGRTPFRGSFERADGKIELVVKLAGYRDARVVLPTVRDATEALKLVRLRTTTVAKKPPEKRPRGAPPSNPSNGSGATVLDPYKDP